MKRREQPPLAPRSTKPRTVWPANAVGVLGGSFNPVHNGHVFIAKTVQEHFHFDPLLIVPSGTPPHKAPFSILPKHRLAMAKLAFAKIPGVEISTYELEKKERAYAIDTIAYFHRTYFNRLLCFIVGADTFIDLPNWYRFPEVLEACSYIVVNRTNGERTSQDAVHAATKLVTKGLLKPTDSSKPFSAGYESRSGSRVAFLPISPPNVSATDVRDRQAKGLDLHGYVPFKVARYLKTHSLYDSAKT